MGVVECKDGERVKGIWKGRGRTSAEVVKMSGGDFFLQAEAEEERTERNGTAVVRERSLVHLACRSPWIWDSGDFNHGTGRSVPLEI
jgi:hypothetical protein